MKIPTDPKERFQYYFDITTGLDAKYQAKIDKISAEQFSYNPEESGQYKKAVKENAAEAELLKKKYKGDYAELSQGYNNSMQQIVENDIKSEEKRANDEVYDSMYSQKYNEWLEEKQRRIAGAKKRYARLYGNAYYNMVKANEEITFMNSQK